MINNLHLTISEDEAVVADVGESDSLTSDIIDDATAHLDVSEQNEAVNVNMLDANNITMNMGNAVQIQKLNDDYNVLRNKPTLNNKVIQGDMHEIDPTVPKWAKSPTKPTYTHDDVGAIGKEELEPFSVESLNALWDSI